MPQNRVGHALRPPVLFDRDGRVFTNSRDVSAFFGKAHGHVLEVIDNLLKNLPKRSQSKFRYTPFVDPQNGQTYRSYDMDRDGFMLLAMGFTGQQ